MLSLSARAKALFLALGIFILGAICGAMGERWFILSRFNPPHEMYGSGPPKRGEHDHIDRDRGDRGPGPSIRRMARDLNLTEEQKVAILKIMATFRTQLDSVRKDIGEKMRKDAEEIRAQIRAELTEEQRAKFDQMEQEREQRWRESRSRRGRGGPDGWEAGPPPKGP